MGYQNGEFQEGKVDENTTGLTKSTRDSLKKVVMTPNRLSVFPRTLTIHGGIPTMKSAKGAYFFHGYNSNTRTVQWRKYDQPDTRELRAKLGSDGVKWSACTVDRIGTKDTICEDFQQRESNSMYDKYIPEWVTPGDKDTGFPGDVIVVFEHPIGFTYEGNYGQKPLFFPDISDKSVVWNIQFRGREEPRNIILCGQTHKVSEAAVAEFTKWLLNRKESNNQTNQPRAFKSRFRPSSIKKNEHMRIMSQSALDTVLRNHETKRAIPKAMRRRLAQIRYARRQATIRRTRRRREFRRSLWAEMQ